ncbi:LLM class F420-dependent oxidoreductase [Glaciihabitans sp. INWT7]|uniref:LLM class F420-dependent oxidoreductase n=1 Tax=Glaciihabitans sp. INWT7 TaxID=2596912 RepID=UPI0016293884|nr:LLM class F420-dependent oxidoreductase [Glaciihabitans sp. INWT7]QNE46664.1 LLM class F420-dependent oxidoreductase [Glaciihabitans sp. INWT7]
MKLGIHFSNFTVPGQPESIASVLAATARVADQGGVSAFTLMDHWFQMEQMGGPAEPMLEGYTGLGFLAGITERMSLGLLVTGVTYRHPGLLAKTIATLDVLSKGRAVLGIGAAWYEREHLGLGVPFPSLRERFEQLEETIQICRQMWSDENGRFDGRHFQLAETICIPRPLQAPRPPIMIGGSGEQKTLRLVARYADSCNLFAVSHEVVKHKIAVLAGHCETEQRDLASIEKTIIGGADPLEDVDGFLASMAQYAAIGVDQITMSPHGSDPVAWTERMVERVLPRLSDV